MTTYTLTAPDHGVSNSTQTRLKEIKFGDGYSQRAPYGLNSMAEIWSVSWSNRTRAEIDAIEDFFRTQAGASWFYWTTPRGQQKKFVCKEWKPVYNNDYDCSLTATWEQVYDL